MGKKSDLSKVESTFVKLYSEEEMDLMKTLDTEKLKSVVAETTANVIRSQREMEANSAYKEAHAVMSDFRSAQSDVKKYQNAKKFFAIALLHSKGIVDCGELEES